jgi:hypothetical protein
MKVTNSIIARLFQVTPSAVTQATGSPKEQLAWRVELYLEEGGEPCDLVERARQIEEEREKRSGRGRPQVSAAGLAKRVQELCQEPEEEPWEEPDEEESKVERHRSQIFDWFLSLGWDGHDPSFEELVEAYRDELESAGWA